MTKEKKQFWDNFDEDLHDQSLKAREVLDTTIIFRCDKKDKEKFESNTISIATTLRTFIKHFNKSKL